MYALLNITIILVNKLKIYQLSTLLEFLLGSKKYKQYLCIIAVLE